MSWVPVTRTAATFAPVLANAFVPPAGDSLTTDWSVPAPAAIELLAAEDRLVVVGAAEADESQRVDVHAGDGSLLYTVHGSRSAWTVDPRGPMLLGATVDGRPAAWPLAGQALANPVLWSMRFGGRVLTQLQLEGEVLIASGLERPRLGDPHPSVLVAALRIAGWEDVSPHGTLRGVERIAECIGEATRHAVVGVHAGGLVLATRDRVQWVDWGLTVMGELEAAGEPVGWAAGWLLVATADGPRLRRLAVGRCEFEIEVREAFDRTTKVLAMPDGGVVLAAGGRVQAFDPGGRMRWKFSRTGTPHALVDAEGTTLFSHGAALHAAKLDGTSWALWKAPEGTGELGPLCMANGRVHLLSRARLFALE